MTNGNARAKREGQAPTQLVELMTALASDYWSVYYVELDRDEGVCFHRAGEARPGRRVHGRVLGGGRRLLAQEAAQAS